ncbi:PAS domain-containing sensor histidine kinase [Calderihabitans maritimus]|uniref:histidine kinase n=1 Tax=Calderihabitans maritimus TaxID=1246530 RepID=A0A1Z5HSK0_9FIRM|nr:PAS domain-containing sensor histidine kinase [Calderihabitans maritimus]GAW92509.1 hypothetical protein PTH_1422 [Calderihabitans maritimus]
MSKEFINGIYLNRNILNWMFDGLVLFDEWGKLLFANQAFLKMTEYDAQELKKISFNDFCLKLFDSETNKSLQEKWPTETTCWVKGKLRTKRNRWLPVKTTILNWPNMLGESLGNVLLAIPVAVEKASDQWQVVCYAMMNALEVAVIGVDAQGKIFLFNRSAERLTNRSYEEVFGKDHDEVFKIPEKQQFLRKALVEGKEVYNQEMDYCWYAGRPGSFVFNACQLRDGDGQIIGAVMLIEETTEKRRLEYEAARAETLMVLSEVAAGVAHEVRNPLTTIRGFVQLLQVKLGEENEYSKYLQLILAEIDRANKIISEFLVAARPKEAKKQLVDLNKIVTETLLLVESQAILQDVEVTKELSDELPLLELVETQIKQVLLNLTRNALQAMPDGGTLSIITYSQDDWVWIKLRDTGVGMPPEHLNKLFSPFFTTKEGGSGLGLTISHRIVKNHGGTIQVESSPGKGTTVTIKLPVTKGGN